MLISFVELMIIQVLEVRSLYIVNVSIDLPLYDSKKKLRQGWLWRLPLTRMKK